MKDKLLKNLPLKLLSILIGFIIWLVVLNMTDPLVQRRFNEIPVSTKNEDVITSLDQVYKIIGGDKVDVTVKGKRSLVESLTVDDFYAVADFNKLSSASTAAIEVRITKYTDEPFDLDWNNQVLRISLEDKKTKQFQVQIDTEGELADGHVLGSVTTSPNMIEVSGGKSKIKRVKSVGVVVDCSGQSSDFNAKLEPILYDENHEIIDSSNVSFSQENIDVSVGVLPTKRIAVNVDVSGKPETGYHLIQTDFKPESVLISGSKENLANAKDIRVPISIAYAKEDVEKDVSIAGYLPDGCTLVDDYSTISIRCDIEKNGNRKFSFVNSDINVRNLPENMTFSYVN
ncbi:MAG: hypothetical protein K6G63_00535, partial [Eubacterium sp.]|nr:hypothetical protein [Eubacterium sp.]